MIDVDEIARVLCEQRWGTGSWAQPKINRSYWRRQARKLINDLGNKFREELLNDELHSS